jgi:threonine dehydratase
VSVDRARVDEAAVRIAPFVHRTPVLRSHALDHWVDAHVFVKAEHLQRVGAFKYRGATNAVQSLTESGARRGVAAHSSGNHGAALALAADARGVPAYVVMPKTASTAKRAAVRRYGAEVTLCDDSLDARRAVLAEVLDRTGAVEIHPFDDERVIAGAGTAALELTQEVPDLDVVVTPIGGGGLCSGTCVAVAPIRVIGGTPRDRASTVADGLRTGCSARTKAILDEHDVEQIVVDEADIVGAMRVVWERTKQVIEPSAAVAFAAAHAAKLDGARVGVICSGGNVDLDALPWSSATSRQLRRSARG